MQLKTVRVLKHLRVHVAEGDHLLASAGSRLLQSQNNGRSWQPLLNTAPNLWQALLAKNSLATRLLRQGIHNVIRLNDQSWLIVVNGGFFCLTADGSHFIPSTAHGKRPLRQGILAHDDSFIFGDYYGNPNRDSAISLYTLSNNKSSLQPLYTFPPGQIRHIHAIQHDPFTDTYWLATGDLDQECFIGQFDTAFKNLQIIGQGSQDWRVVSFIFTPEAVYWGTDDPDSVNHIWRYDRQTGQSASLGALIGPVYYSKQVGSHLLFATTVERPGQGNQDTYARLYALDMTTQTLTELYKHQKDRWHPKLFGYGYVEFANGPTRNNELWACLHGLKGGLQSIQFRLEDS